MPIETVNRRELKYLIRKADYGDLIVALSQYLPNDDNSGLRGYRVRSLYFDSIDDQDYHDVIDGVEDRKKIRLRIYSPYDQMAKLEWKIKNGTQQRKISIGISKEQAQQLADGDYGFLFSLDEPSARDIYQLMTSGLYRPKVLVEYHRKAFIHPANHIRITIDSGICSNTVNLDLFSHSINWIPVFAPDIAVLEVKYNGFLLGYIQQILEKMDLTLVSNSKYAQARELYFH